MTVAGPALREVGVEPRAIHGAVPVAVFVVAVSGVVGVAHAGRVGVAAGLARGARLDTAFELAVDIHPARPHANAHQVAAVPLSRRARWSQACGA
tara:strand:+ start:321 stop:605 length:285 start_codon:yes stop_codon:yes gene_type:complete